MQPGTANYWRGLRVNEEEKASADTHRHNQV